MKYWCDFLDSDEAPTKDTASPRKSGVAYLTENLIKRLTKEENVTQITSLHVTLGKELNKKIKVGPDMTRQSAHVRPILTIHSSCKTEYCKRLKWYKLLSCVTGWSGECDMFEWNKVNSTLLGCISLDRCREEVPSNGSILHDKHLMYRMLLLKKNIHVFHKYWPFCSRHSRFIAFAFGLCDLLSFVCRL